LLGLFDFELESLGVFGEPQPTERMVLSDLVAQVCPVAASGANFVG
jgi:hypothetical protein